MLPQNEMPPELLEAMGGGMAEGMPADEEPEEIEVPGGEGESDEDLIRTAIEALEEAAQNESDDADSAALTKIVAELYKLTAGQQDAQIAAMGGNPKDMRGMVRAMGSGVG